MPPALVAASSPWPFCASPQGKHKAVMDGRKGLPAQVILWKFGSLAEPVKPFS